MAYTYSCLSEGDAGIQPVPGYIDGILQGYTGGQQDYISCVNAIKVYIRLNPMFITEIEDQAEAFRSVFVLKLYWLDPVLKRFRSKITPRSALESEIDVIVTGKNEKGDLQYVLLEKEGIAMSEEDFSRQKRMIIKKDSYVSFCPPDWGKHFFPKFSFTNLHEEPMKTVEETELLWCSDQGGFVCYKVKYDAKFKETLELHHFPLDRQLCRIRLTAEMPVEEFQFVPIEGDKIRHDVKTCDMWNGQGCVLYVRHADEAHPYSVQRSCANILFHVERVGTYYFHSILLMVCLVNCISLCGFSIPYDNGDPGNRLGHLGTCFVAVLAYRYVIHDSLPKKGYLTYADRYILFACVFQAVICFETAAMSWLISSDFCSAAFDSAVGLLFAVLWVLTNAVLYMLWAGSLLLEDWQSIYDANGERYHPVNECAECGARWVGRREQQNEFCSKHPQADVKRHVYTPFDCDPVVQPQPFPKPPDSLEQLVSWT